MREDLYKECEMKDLKYIDEIDLDVGYNVGSVEDKIDFYNRLPEKEKRKIVQNFIRSKKNEGLADRDLKTEQ